VTICENCGAETVDARGICRTCGWQARSGVLLDDSTPSLGETRAADVPGAPAGGYRSSSPAPTRGTAPSYGATYGGASPAPRGSTARFCGTCGARLEPGEAFCGQCGTPVGAGGDYTRNAPASPPSRYYVGGKGPWAGSGDAYTEEFTTPPEAPTPPYNRSSGIGGGHYVPGGFGAPTPQPAAADSRAGRLIFGLLCILGSLISAVGAVYLAAAH
jgi:hypothetical protein